MYARIATFALCWPESAQVSVSFHLVCKDVQSPKKSVFMTVICWREFSRKNSIFETRDRTP